MLGITDYLWRLIPANPILLRVVESGGKRRRDLFFRCGYLAFLIGVVLVMLVTSSQQTSGADLSSLAKTSASIFQVMSFWQLLLVSLLAPIFTAGAITQEKDSQTYDILLATPLSNGQIVLGSLLSRLFFVIALLISGIPVFSITQIFGGVAIRSIIRSFLIAAATAFVTGALAMAIAVFKVGTRRTIFSFYLFICLYLVGLFLLDKVPYFWVPGHRVIPTVESHVSWFTGINPFLALKVIFNDPTYTPPELLDLPERLRGWPIGWYLSNPAGFYVSFMFFLSFVMILPSVILLRRIAQSTTSLKTLLLQRLNIVSGDRTRKPRVVWSNPIAWREAKTKASAARATVLRYGFMAAGVIGALVMISMASTPAPVFDQFVNDTSYVPADPSKPGSRALFKVYSTSGQATIHPLVDAGDPNPSRLLLHPQAEDSSNIGANNPGNNPANTTTFDPNNPVAPPPTVPSPIPAGQQLLNFGDLRGKLEVEATQDRTDEKGTKVWDSITVREVGARLSRPAARSFLLGAVAVEFAVILLIITNAAASTVTREKEDGSLDLLLATPITSRYYVWGKLRGLVSFVMPLVGVPVASVLLFVIADAFRRWGNWDDPRFQWTVFPEAVLILPAVLVIAAAFAAILGMQMSLRCRTTVTAVMSSVGIVVGVCATLGWCGYKILDTSGSGGSFVGIVAGAFSPFTVMTLLIDPYTFARGLFAVSSVSDEDIAGYRLMILIFSFCAVGTYTAVVWSMYKSMVRNFDMTIRRQSR